MGHLRGLRVRQIQGYKIWTRPIAAGLVLSLAMPLAQASTFSPAGPADGQQQQTTPTTPSQTQQPSPNQTPSLEVRDQNGNVLNPQTAPDKSQDGNTKPVGTAAAPQPRTTGITASRPAGAVIAPAKQKRARTFIIRFGIVIGAAVAVGAVVLLSKGSPSRPSTATATTN